MASQFADIVIRFRWLIVLSFIASVFFIASGASNITFSSSYRVFFSEDNEQLVAFEKLQNTYSKTDNVFIVLEPQENAVFSQETLTAIQDLTDRAWQIPFSTRVDSLTNFQHTEAEEDDLLVNDLVEFPDEADFDRVQNIAINEPLLVKRLVSPEAHVTVVNATVQLPQKSENEILEVVSFARDMMEQFKEDYPDINYYLTGSTLLSNAFSEAAQKDMKTLTPIMLVVVVLTLWLMLRSLSATLATVTVIILSIMTAMGLFGWLGWVMTGPVSAAPTIILTMAVADSVHVLVSFLFNLRQGLGKSDAMRESIRINLQPVFITSVTTILGFMTMNFSEVPPFRDLGNTVAMGVAAAFFLSVIYLPALVMILPVKVKREEATTHQIMDKLASWVITNRRLILAGTGIITVVVALLIPTNRINDEFIAYFKEGVQFRDDTDFTAENLSGIYTMQYSLITAEPGGISDPKFLAEVEAFSDWVKTFEEVVHVNTLSDTFKRLNKNMHADDDSYYRLPENKELAAQYLLLYEMSLPYGLDLNNQINVDKSSLMVTITLHNISSERTLELEDTFAQKLEEQVSIVDFYAASPNIMFSHIGKRNVDSMISGVAYALLLICIIMMFALRSWKLGMLSLIPNLIPIACAFGLWALLSGNVGISIGTAVGMILGIVVDDTVHFLSKYQRARRENGYSAEQAVRYAFAMVGTALWVTTFVLVAGFIVLSTSDFNMNAHMGIFTASTITIALIFDFFALPAILLGAKSDGLTRNEQESDTLPKGETEAS